VGALGHMVGNDLFALLFGRSPGLITGGSEGLLVGAATGLGIVLATRYALRRTAWRMAPAVVVGLIAGAGIFALGGRLMVGSLAELAKRFPGSPLQVNGVLGEDGLGALGLILATSIECALFTGFTSAAIIASRRLRDAPGH
jgi:hypothetical protein